MDQAKPATYIPAEASAFRYIEKSSPQTSNVKLMTYGVYELTGAVHSGDLAHPSEEALLFCWQGQATAMLKGARYVLEHYDALYIPRGATYQLAQETGASKVVILRAPADKAHPVFHAEWKKFSRDERRIRHLKGKDVFMMFDVSEAADKLVAGITVYQPNQRSWPPHNHTDQEEIYIFVRGRGSMEVYEDEETRCFVHTVNEGDAVAIPLLNYHPVFSQEQEIDFKWCVAGERYFVFDKNKDLLTGKKAS